MCSAFEICDKFAVCLIEFWGNFSVRQSVPGQEERWLLQGEAFRYESFKKGNDCPESKNNRTHDD